MCGIAGWIGEAEVDTETRTQVLKALHHRGPDARGCTVDTCWGLLHTRLSVIDTSHSADQPFASEDGSVLVVFNGEIYNHRELRRSLEAAGHRFRTHCDTEVIPALYLEEGVGFLSRLRGMFAIALLDLRKHTLYLARDRFGIKPLFMATTPRAVFFGSEIGALSRFGGIDLRPNPQAVADFIALHVVPGPSTFYRGIENVAPGSVVTVCLDDGRPTVAHRAFHQWRIAPDPSLTLDDATGLATELLGRGVTSQLESDVPLGALLSGGIDSSLIAASAMSSVPDLRTFSVRFDDPAFDESDAAGWVASHIGSRHEVLDFAGGTPSWHHLTTTLRACGQPFADTSLFAVDALSQLVRQRVTVALSGDGGDEAFGGYDHYTKLPRLALAVGTVPFWVRQAVAPPARAVTAVAARARLVPGQLPHRIRDLAGERDLPRALADLGSWIRPREFKHLWRGPRVDPASRHFSPTWEADLPPDASAVERLTAMAVEADVRIRMANDYLPKVDTASMRWSLEVRVPMLDEELFDLGLRLPPSLRAAGGTTKRVLRSVASSAVPGVAALPKHGFGVPVDRWMSADLRARVRQAVGDPGGPVRDFVSDAWLTATLDAFARGTVPSGLTRQGLYQRAIMVLALHVFLAGEG
jgi:asparagine synthase (glutamine-hydrolysing)